MSPQHDNGHQASGISHQRKAEEREKNIFDVLRNLPIALSRRSKRSRVEQRTKGKPQKLEFEYRQPDFIDHDYWRRTSRGKEKKKNEDAPDDWQVQAMAVEWAASRGALVSRVKLPWYYLLQRYIRPWQLSPLFVWLQLRNGHSVGKPEHNAVVPRCQRARNPIREAGCCLVSCRSNSYNLSRMGGGVLLKCICIFVASVWAVELKSEIHK